MKTLKLYFALAFCLSSLLVFPQTKIVSIAENDQFILLNKNHLLVFQDTTNLLDIEAISKNGQNFKEIKTEIPHEQVSTFNLWVKFMASNSAQNRIVINVANPMLENITFYSRSAGKPFYVNTISKNNFYNQRTYDNPNYVFDLPLTDTPTVFECYLLLNSYSEMQVPVYFGSAKAGYRAGLVDDMGFGLYAGIMLVIFLYNLFLLFSVRDRIYFFYIIYILSVALAQISIKGYGFKYLWPEFPAFEKYSMFLFSCLTAFTSIGFLREFLDIKNLTPKINKLLLSFCVLYLIPLFVGLGEQKHIAYNLLNIFALGLTFAMLFAAIYVRIKFNSRPALFFIIAWSAFLVSIVVFVLKDVGVLPFNNITSSSIQFGSAIEVILLSIALADRINILKIEKEKSQEEALMALRENERIVREQNIILEQKVEERTLELQETNTDLSNALTQLKDAQTQLVDAEKMASLGQLTAGIAHEINNPINFVSSNIRPLRRDVDDLISILEKYDLLRENFTSDEIKSLMTNIKQVKEEIDYDYIRKEIEMLLKGMEEGASRTVEIVKGLKNFSRLDEAEIKHANINEGILSTLILLNNQLGDKVKIEKVLGSLPDIECYPGKLNQVFMNLLNNSIYAIRNFKDGHGKITVNTSFENDMVVVKIADTGMGMTDEVKSNMFDPFFTTKEVGEGTGLGLSIVYKIIEMHKGSIQVNSSPGEGAEFVIKLPKLLK